MQEHTHNIGSGDDSRTKLQLTTTGDAIGEACDICGHVVNVAAAGTIKGRYILCCEFCASPQYTEDIDEHLEDSARMYERRAALMRALIGQLATPATEAWAEKEEEIDRKIEQAHLAAGEKGEALIQGAMKHATDEVKRFWWWPR
jgi:hypothetical protein